MHLQIIFFYKIWISKNNVKNFNAIAIERKKYVSIYYFCTQDFTQSITITIWYSQHKDKFKLSRNDNSRHFEIKYDMLKNKKLTILNTSKEKLRTNSTHNKYILIIKKALLLKIYGTKF